MVKYQNATRSANEITAVEVGALNGSLLTIRSKNSTFSPRPGYKTDMVAGVIRLVKPSVSTEGDTPVSVDESVEIRFNVRKGATASIAALHTEAGRILGLSTSKFNLALGLVPPSEASFEAP